MNLEALTAGWQQFKQNEYQRNKEFLEKLAHGHSDTPIAVVTCSDPRLNLNWITSQRAGISPHTNPGGIVPPYGLHSVPAASYFDLVVNAFKVEDLILLGHTTCKMVAGLMKPGTLPTLGRGIATWGVTARDTRETTQKMFGNLSGEALNAAAVQVHTLLQVQHAMTYPVIKDAVREGKLHVHPMIYDIGNADLKIFSRQQYKFVPLTERERAGAKANLDQHVCGPECLQHI